MRKKEITVRTAISALTAVFLASAVEAQVAILVADRTADRIVIARDLNRNGVIDGGETASYFDAANAAGTPAPLNPNALGFWQGLTLIGDQDNSARRWLWARDGNGDGDAQDEGESGVWVDATNAASLSFAFPTGVAFGNDDQIALVNAGNGFGGDDVFLVRDLNNDGDANDSGEVTRWVSVNGFGANGPMSPQEACYDNAGKLYLRTSGTTNGVFVLRDADGSGLIDLLDEMAVYFGLGNGSDIVPGTGFDITIDPVRGESHYFWQTITGGIDQLYRLSDNNRDGDAMDQGEAVLVYTTAEAGFVSIDTLPLADGSVLISDNSGNRVLRLVDLDGDGLFLSAGERTDFLTSGLSASRALALVHDVGCSAADLGRQGGVLGGDGVLDSNDFIVFIDLFFRRAPLADQGRQGGQSPGDGRFDNNDFIVFIDAFFAGCAD